MARASAALVATCLVVACSEPPSEPPPSATRGRAILAAFRDSLPSNSGNALRCSSCHLDEGTRASALPWLGSASRYPRYRSRSGGEERMEQRINDCITRSLAGREIPDTSSAMRDMIAYLETLGTASRPEVLDTVKVPGHQAAGERVYAASCARCHGVQGEGGLAPAVWGAESFSIGAGLARQKVFATFVRANMPYDRPGTLTPRQAADVAAYVLAQPRQDYPGKELDWPKGDPPADVAYATDAARAAGKATPAARPLLPRRVSPR